MAGWGSSQRSYLLSSLSLKRRMLKKEIQHIVKLVLVFALPAAACMITTPWARKWDVHAASAEEQE